MSKFIQDGTGVVVSVSDEKDGRFVVGWKPVNDSPEPQAAKQRPKK